jgi:hypothetical protein
MRIAALNPEETQKHCHNRGMMLPEIHTNDDTLEITRIMWTYKLTTIRAGIFTNGVTMQSYFYHAGTPAKGVIFTKLCKD